MKTLKYKSRGSSVHLLEEVLVKLGYDVYVSNYFGKDTDKAVRDFQLKNNLIVDGKVGPKTWSKLIEKEQQLISFNDKFLSEQDLIDFADNNNLELATVKAVNEVESRGKGFLIHGRPVILFEGHVFWRELKKRGLDPNDFLAERYENVLYEKWTRKYYLGGAKEYTRLEKAAGMSDLPAVHDAAYSSASWGAFQIMGFHYKKLGYASVDHFVSEMYEHEREHLNAFGKFIRINSFGGKQLIDWLKEQNWAKFAHGYNGSGYKKNKYDIKLQQAYEKYTH
jgi:hypothetical protein